MGRSNNLLDNLFSEDIDEVPRNDSLISDDIVIPLRCSKCKTSIICSILPTFINFSKIRLFISIEQCPYFQPIKNAEPRKTNN